MIVRQYKSPLNPSKSPFNQIQRVIFTNNYGKSRVFMCFLSYDHPFNKDDEEIQSESSVWRPKLLRVFFGGYFGGNIEKDVEQHEHSYRGTPNHPFLDGIFPHKNHPAMGVPKF